jgi:hypothetical protein
MPDLRFTLPGHATKKNSPQPGHRPSAAFEDWEGEGIKVLRRLRLTSDLPLPITTPATLDIVVHVRGCEGDAVGYAQAVGDLLDGTRARFAHRKEERRLKLGLPFVCDYQIVVDDRLFNRGVSARVVRCAAIELARVEVVIRW